MARLRIKRRKNSRAEYGSPNGLAAKLGAIEAELVRKDLPQFSVGDTVRAHVKIKEGEKERIQAFEGTLIAKSNRGAGKSLCIRKISHGVGVERIFMESSPKLAKLEVVSPGKVRRSKLYYIRGLQGKAAKIDRDSSDTPSAPSSTPASH